MTDNEFEMETGVDLEATTDVHLIDPATGEPWHDDQGAPVTITVVSGESDAFKRKVHEIQGRYTIKRRNNVGPSKGSLTFEQARDCEAEIFAAVIRGWHLVKRNGGPKMDVPFTAKNAINWCKANPLFTRQLSSGADDLAKFAKDLDGNFTQKGSTRSAKASGAKSD